MADDPPLGQTEIFAEPKSTGPQVWAVVITIAGLYYVWTRILGKSLPNIFRSVGGGNRIGTRGIVGRAHGIGGSENRRAEIAAARERQQKQLETVARQAKNNGSSTVRERTNTATTPGNIKSTDLTIEQQHQLLQLQQQRKKKENELEEKKTKQRKLYLKQKALKEKEEEMRTKDKELGPGWRHRENPDAATALGNMDPQSGDGGGGGYKAQSCSLKKKRGGG